MEKRINALCYGIASTLLIFYFVGVLAAAQQGGGGAGGNIKVSNGAGSDAGESRLTSALIDLHEDNWQSMLKGEWMVEFFAPWCPACKNLAPTWERFATAASEINVHVAKIDVTTSPSLSGRFFVTALPTIYHVKDGEFRQYRGARDGDALLFFVKQKQWQKVDPISAWKKPDTIHMSILSYFFKLSHTLKDFNARLQEEYGLPTWGSYALFAVGTIFVGAALGLLLVCIVDFLYPPKKSHRQNFSETKDAYNAVEDIANDEIEDDAPPNDDDEENNDHDDDVDEEDDEHEDENDEENEKENRDGRAGDEADNNSTSEGEKNSNSESEEPESDKLTPKNSKSTKSIEEKSSPSEIRKRKSKAKLAD